MTKEQYNSLAPYQKEVYDKWNTGNRRGPFVAWGIGADLMFEVMYYSLNNILENMTFCFTAT